MPFGRLTVNLKVEAMKKIVFVFLLCFGAGSMVHAQFLKTIKAKAKAAVDNSVDRSTNKLIDKAINKPADSGTDTVLAKAERKVNALFKKKKNKNGDTDQGTAPASDSTAIKPAGTDSSTAVIPESDSTAVKPRSQDLKAQILPTQYRAFAANTCYKNSCVATNQLSVYGNSQCAAITRRQERTFLQDTEIIQRKPGRPRYG